ncbi:MAG: restriction endonuclease [Deltaproteobacteria bacterium]|jgi:restriction system protein|nr:restriction endonuclease [Deltaproteobacteria bacterium]
MKIPKPEKMYKEVMEALSDGKMHSLQDLRDIVADKIGLSHEDRKIRTKNDKSPSFDYNITWTKTHLRNAGLVDYPMWAHVQLTEEGKKVCLENPPVIDTKFLMKYESYRQFILTKNAFYDQPDDDKEEEDIPLRAIENMSFEEKMDEAFIDMDVSLIDDLLIILRKKNQTFFSDVAIQILENLGYVISIEENYGISENFLSDHQINFIMSSDRLSLWSFLVEAKHFNRDVDVTCAHIQKFVDKAAKMKMKGVFVTNAVVLADAKKYAKEHNIVCIDGEEFASLMIEFELGVSTVKSYDLYEIDKDFFDK